MGGLRTVFGVLLMVSLAFARVLTPEEAFNLTLTPQDEALEVRIVLGEDIYLYEEEFKLEIIAPTSVLLNPFVSLPVAVEYDGYQVYSSSLHVNIPLSLIREKIGTVPFELAVSWQACSKMGLCYQPMRQEFRLDAKGKLSTGLSEHGTIAQRLASGGALWAIVSFFGFGLLLSLTPCVFPMIPILSSIIVSQGGASLGAKRGLWLSFVYVFAMSVAYAGAGVLAGIFGANLQSALQAPWVIWLFSGVFVALAFSMFGFYELQLPKSIQGALSKTSRSVEGQGVGSVALMGFLSALIVGPCVAAPLAGALLYISQTGDALLGGVALFVMSLGMGVPLLLIGASAGRLLPKPGKWMNATKAVFGVMMLGVAIWMLGRVLPSWVELLLWSVLCLGLAAHLWSVESEKPWVNTVVRTSATVFLLYGATLFVGSLAKANDPLNPLAPFFGSGSTVGLRAFEPVDSIGSLQRRIEQTSGVVMVDFYADWCVSCKELESITFADARVQEAFKSMTLLKVDVTKNTAQDKALLAKFGLFGPPGLIFYRDGVELPHAQIVGFKTPEAFLEHLKTLQ
ncbi:protein-disulfide reductase DsbD [Sulfurospirillum sp. T05]|uniref:Protein-disulfide reductase DsbD n=1 Tax=Sulfurospirillum tamanense TaxID=2813362 RepID=A0ABS2WQA8_9BACT|nr:protein-disulfide reductase DsbD [Sulfurospirillum tamanensis]MBN2963755.1 protein-disulfide reductase DsbD [Sulfurospirillum tamanensis]